MIKPGLHYYYYEYKDDDACEFGYLETLDYYKGSRYFFGCKPVYFFGFNSNLSISSVGYMSSNQLHGQNSTDQEKFWHDSLDDFNSHQKEIIIKTIFTATETA